MSNGLKRRLGMRREAAARMPRKCELFYFTAGMHVYCRGPRRIVRCDDKMLS